MSDSSRPANALVTGAARGLGLAIARRLGQERVSLTLVDLRADELTRAAAELAADGIAVATEVGDVTVANDMQRAVRRAASSGALDLLVHVAGISPTMADGAEILRVNLGGTLAVLDAADASLVSGSRVVLIASTSATLGGAPFDDAIGDPCAPDLATRLAPHLNHTGLAYSISKRAVVLLVRKLALPLGRRGIRINCVSPGLADTVMGHQEERETPMIGEMQKHIPFPRMVRPDEVAAAVAFLASDEASFITGVELPVDGGCLATIGAAERRAPSV